MQKPSLSLTNRLVQTFDVGLTKLKELQIVEMILLEGVTILEYFKENKNNNFGCSIQNLQIFVKKATNGISYYKFSFQLTQKWQKYTNKNSYVLLKTKCLLKDRISRQELENTSFHEIEYFKLVYSKDTQIFSIQASPDMIKKEKKEYTVIYNWKDTQNIFHRNEYNIFVDSIHLQMLLKNKAYYDKNTNQIIINKLKENDNDFSNKIKLIFGIETINIKLKFGTQDLLKEAENILIHEKTASRYNIAKCCKNIKFSSNLKVKE